MDLDSWLVAATAEEKAALLAGRDFWSMHAVDAIGLPSIVLTDGPHGVRLQSTSTDELSIGANLPATCFPTAASLASSWDPALVERVGVALGLESRAYGVSVLLGPGANIKRTPLCGRNFEYFSEDPRLSAAMAAAWIRGIQSTGVGASLKHFAVNNQEELRFTVDAVVDERAMREIYLASFEAAVREAQPWTVMAAYNRVNGDYACEHPWLLDTVLRDDWGYDGLVMSDWGAVNDRVAGLRAGLDLQMPGVPGPAQPVVEALEDGSLDVEVVDTAVRRAVQLVERTAQARVPVEVDVEAHQALAQEVAAAGTVLLRNDGVLPLAPGVRVAVVGEFAERPRYQGAGSSLINPRRVVSAMDLLRERGVDLVYAPGYDRYADRPDPEMLDEARRAAVGCDVALVFVGLPEVFETEGADRVHMRMPAAHDALVDTVAAVAPRTVVVLSNGSPVEMPWLEHVNAVVEGYLGGQEGGGAVARVLLGELEPAGRLAETFPARWSDHPVSMLPTGPRCSEYRESLYVGYRWFDSVDDDVLFPFGHGLSYTTFAWHDASVSASRIAANDSATVRVRVENTGARAGSEVVQVYLRPLTPEVFRPVHHLAGFAKVHLEPGESADVEIEVPARAFARWSPSRGDWVVDPGGRDVEVAASSRDVRAVLRLRVDGDDMPEPDAVPAWYLRPHRGTVPDRADWERLLGRSVDPNVPEGRGERTLNTPLSQLLPGPVGRWLRRTVAARYGAAIGDDPVAQVMVNGTFEDGSMRMLSMFSQGRIDRRTAEAVAAVADGRVRDAVRLLRDAG